MNEAFDTEKSILQPLHRESWTKRGMNILVKRDDLIHPEVSGNKWRKLKYHILQAQQEKNKGIITFGGAYSNHLLATASACKQLKMKCIGIIRGEELNPESNQTLKNCQELGMQLEFVSREEYHLRNDYAYKRDLRYTYPGYYVVSEGGASWWGMVGCLEIWKELPPMDHLFLALGTGTTTAGLLLGAPENSRIHAVPVLKGFEVEEELLQLGTRSGLDVEEMQRAFEQLSIHPEYHFGGYGKTTEELSLFRDQMQQEFQLPLDRVYTAKAFYAMIQELEHSRYDGQTILFLHTGGLQGNQ